MSYDDEEYEGYAKKYTKTDEKRVIWKITFLTYNLFFKEVKYTWQ